MDKEKAIELIKQALSEIPHLRELHYDNQEFVSWFDRVRNIIKAGLDKDDLKRFSSSRSVHIRGIFKDDVYQEDYLDRLTDYETALKSIIEKHELLGIEVTLKAAPEALIDIFDKMQFHPKIVEVSRSLFKTKHYGQAIFEAFKAVNNFVKARTGQSLDGKDLMAKVFRKGAPIIKLNELSTKSERDEQEGFMFLYMGAMVGIRNPKAHDNIVQTDPYRTLEYLSLASLLIKRAEEGKLERIKEV